MSTLTPQQVAAKANIELRAFTKMNAQRKPPRLMSGHYDVHEVELWLAKRKTRGSNSLVVSSITEPEVQVLTEARPTSRGRNIEGEDEHVLNERLEGRAFNVKVLDKTLVDMKSDLADLEKMVAKKRSQILEYMAARKNLTGEAKKISKDLDAALEVTIAEIEKDLRFGADSRKAFQL